MIYFIVIYFLILVASFGDFIPKIRRWSILLSILLLSMLAGWRNMGGGDFRIYLEVFYGLRIPNFSGEPGYMFLNDIFSSVGLSYNTFLFAYSLISIWLLVDFLKRNTKFPTFSLMFYMASYFFFYNMVLNRQMFCMSLALWIFYIWNYNKVVSLLLIVIGALFHNSILVLLPFLLIFEMLQRTKGSKYWLAFFGIFILGCILISPEQLVLVASQLPGLSFLSTRLIAYNITGASVYTLSKIEYLKMLIGLAVILPCLRTLLKDNMQHIWVFMYFVGLVLLIWTRNIEILFRIFVYFDLSLLVLLSKCLEIWSKSMSPHRCMIFKTGAYVCMGVLALFSILYRTYHFGNADFWQYHFYFLT